jgi:type IX secretion system PorP/SprF family membrane protein
MKCNNPQGREQKSNRLLNPRRFGRVHFVLSFFIFYSLFSYSQDIHFTQFNFSPLNQNPANTNLFDGDMRFVGNFKNQWQSVPVAYNTASASMDMNFVTLKNHDRIGGGLLFYYDRAGDSKFTSIHIAYSMSYQLNFGKNDQHTLCLGIQLGIINRSFDYTRLFFDNQFNGDAFSPNINPDEAFSKTNFTFLDLGTGITYKWNKGIRKNLTIGFSIAHFNSPQQSFYNDLSVKLDPRYNISVRGQFKIAAKCDIVPEFLWQRQATQQEFVPGVHFKTYLALKTYTRIALNTGVYYRIGDAPAILLGMDYNNLQVNCSYDINSSNFTPASRYNGGFEISVIYIVSRIKKLGNNFASCPIF